MQFDPHGHARPSVLPVPKKRGRPKGTTDRKAYMRELMRKRRAAAKQAKP